MDVEIPPKFAVLLPHEVENLKVMIAAGGKVSACKAIQDVHGLGLKESKDIVDYLVNSTDWRKN